MKKILYILMCVAFVSCHSSKKGTKQNGTNVPDSALTTINTPVKKADPVPEKKEVYMPQDMNFTSKVKAKVAANGQDISTSGSLRMRWNDVIQLSLVDPILGITEVGRIEFSQDNVLVVDRINKQYCQESYEKIASLTKQPISFDEVQTLVWKQAEANVGNTVNITIPAKKKVNIELRLTNRGTSSDWDAHTTVSSRYKKVDAETLFKALMQ